MRKQSARFAGFLSLAIAIVALALGIGLTSGIPAAKAQEAPEVVEEAAAFPAECNTPDMATIPTWNGYVKASQTIRDAAAGQTAGEVSVSSSLEGFICLDPNAYPADGQLWPTKEMVGVRGHYDVPAGQKFLLTIPNQGVFPQGEKWALGGYQDPPNQPQPVILVPLGLFVINNIVGTPTVLTATNNVGVVVTQTLTFVPLIGGSGAVAGYVVPFEYGTYFRMELNSQRPLEVGSEASAQGWVVEGNSFVRPIPATPTSTATSTGTSTPTASSTSTVTPTQTSTTTNTPTPTPTPTATSQVTVLKLYTYGFEFECETDEAPDFQKFEVTFQDGLTQTWGTNWEQALCGGWVSVHNWWQVVSIKVVTEASLDMSRDMSDAGWRVVAGGFNKVIPIPNTPTPTATPSETPIPLEMGLAVEIMNGEVVVNATITNTTKNPIVGNGILSIRIDVTYPITSEVVLAIPLQGTQGFQVSAPAPKDPGIHYACMGLIMEGSEEGIAFSCVQFTVVVSPIYLPIIMTPPMIWLNASPLVNCLSEDLTQLRTESADWTEGWFGDTAARNGAVASNVLGVINLDQSKTIVVCVHNPTQMPLGAHVIPIINGEQDWTLKVDLHPEHRGVLTFAEDVEAVVFVSRTSR